LEFDSPHAWQTRVVEQPLERISAESQVNGAIVIVQARPGCQGVLEVAGRNLAAVLDRP
jgi:hypothetical protein